MTADFSKLPPKNAEEDRLAALPEGQRLLEELFRGTQTGLKEQMLDDEEFDAMTVKLFAEIAYAFAERWRINDVLKAAVKDGQLDRAKEATEAARTAVTLFLSNGDADEIQAELLKSNRLDLVSIVLVSIIKGMLIEMSKATGRSVMDVWRAILLVYERRDAGVDEPPPPITPHAPDWWDDPPTTEGPTT